MAKDKKSKDPNLIDDSEVMDDTEFKKLLANPDNIALTDLLIQDKQNEFLSAAGWKFNVVRYYFP